MKKRQEVEKYIIDSITKIDKDNGEKYKKFFKSLSNKAFDEFMNTLKNKKTAIMIYLPNLQKSITNDTIFKLAKFFNLKIFDKIRYKNNYTNKYYFSNIKYMILKLPVRRVKQYLFDKISLPESDKHISKLSGQVLKPDKGSKISLIETYMLSNRKLEKSILEYIKVRGGDIKVYNEFKSKILENGFVYLNDLDLKDSKTRSTIVTDDLLKGIHLDVGIIKEM